MKAINRLFLSMTSTDKMHGSTSTTEKILELKRFLADILADENFSLMTFFDQGSINVGQASTVTRFIKIVPCVSAILSDLYSQ
jgi:hypothetical protein